MIETIIVSNSKRFFCFEIDSYYRVFIDKRSKYFRVSIRRCNELDLLIDGYIEHFEIKRLPLLIKYLQSCSRVMSGDAIANRLLRIFLICVYKY